MKYRYVVTAVDERLADRSPVGTIMVDEKRHDKDGWTSWLIHDSETGSMSTITGWCIGPHRDNETSEERLRELHAELGQKHTAVITALRPYDRADRSFDYALTGCCGRVEYGDLDEMLRRIVWSEDCDEHSWDSLYRRDGGDWVEMPWDEEVQPLVDAEAVRLAEKRQAEAAAAPPRPWKVYLSGPRGKWSWWSQHATKAQADMSAAELPDGIVTTVTTGAPPD